MARPLAQLGPLAGPRRDRRSRLRDGTAEQAGRETDERTGSALVSLNQYHSMPSSSSSSSRPGSERKKTTIHCGPRFCLGTLPIESCHPMSSIESGRETSGTSAWVAGRLFVHGCIPPTRLHTTACIIPLTVPTTNVPSSLLAGQEAQRVGM